MRCLLEFVLLNAPKSNKIWQVFGPVFVRKSTDHRHYRYHSVSGNNIDPKYTVSRSGTKTTVPVVFSIEKAVEFDRKFNMQISIPSFYRRNKHLIHDI